MFKFVALCAFLAAATASPGAIISAPLAYSTGIAPAVTTYSAGSYYNPAQLVYSSPLAAVPYSSNYVHLIKKRSPSPQFIIPSAAAFPSYAPYGAPLATSYAAAPVAYTSPLAAAAYAAPVVHSAPVFPAAHLIKKRSAPLLATPVVSAYSAAPIVSTYSASPVVSTYSVGPAVSTYSTLPSANIIASSYFPNGPLAYTQFIKK